MSKVVAKELRRRSYLDAMGVVTHISRMPLPGAAPTRKLFRRESLKTPDVQDSALESANVVLKGRIDVKLDASKPQPETAAKPQVKRELKEQVKAAPFSVMLAVTGDCLWLEEIPHRSVNQHYTALLSAIAAALSLPAPRWLQFDWPIHTNAQLGLDEQAARQMLEGYLGRQWTQFASQRLVILGDKTRRRLSDMQLPENVVFTQSAWDMLSNPALKPMAWRELRVLR